MHAQATGLLHDAEAAMPHAIQAVVFDLDGVITETAEYHYRAWKRLANEEQIP